MALNSSMIRRKLDNHWYINSGATKHMTFEKDLIVFFFIFLFFKIFTFFLRKKREEKINK